jgi:hypothetical protein
VADDRRLEGDDRPTTTDRVTDLITELNHRLHVRTSSPHRTGGMISE